MGCISYPWPEGNAKYQYEEIGRGHINEELTKKPSANAENIIAGLRPFRGSVITCFKGKIVCTWVKARSETVRGNDRAAACLHLKHCSGCGSMDITAQLCQNPLGFSSWGQSCLLQPWCIWGCAWMMWDGKVHTAVLLGFQGPFLAEAFHRDTSTTLLLLMLGAASW